MDRIDSLSMRLCRVAPSIRTALVAECLGRVYPIYQEAWSGDYCPAIRRSLELGRMYGCGLPIDPVELQGCKEYVEDVLNYYHEDGFDILSATVTVSFRLLESMSPDEGEAMLAVARGLYATLNTANSAEAMVIDYPLRQRHIEVAVAEEEARQEEALTSVTQWTGIADRKMFDGLGGKPPAWLLAWQTCPTHWADG